MELDEKLRLISKFFSFPMDLGVVFNPEKTVKVKMLLEGHSVYTKFKESLLANKANIFLGFAVGDSKAFLPVSDALTDEEVLELMELYKLIREF